MRKKSKKISGFLLTVFRSITQNTLCGDGRAREKRESIRKTSFKTSSDPFERVPKGSGVWCVPGRSWQGAISMAKKKKKAAKKAAKKKKGHG